MSSQTHHTGSQIGLDVESLLSFNRYLPENLKSIDDHAEALRLRIFLILIFLCIGPLAPLFLLFFFLSLAGVVDLWWPTLSVGGFLFAQSSCLFYFIKSGNLNLCSIIYSAIIFFLVGTAVALTGGWDSPVCLFLLALPVIACLVISRLLGIAYSLSVLLLYSTFFLTRQYGYEFPQLIPEEFLFYTKMGMWFTTLFFIIGCLMFFDFSASDLSNTMKRERKKIEFDLDFDELTKLYKKGALVREINNRQNDIQSGTIQAIIYIHIDNLKEINQSYGYESGDAFLVELARAIDFNSTKNKGESDSDYIDALYSHYSPDSFVIFIPNIASVGDIINLIFRTKNNLDKNILLPSGLPVTGRYSIGAAITENQHFATEYLIAAAIDQSKDNVELYTKVNE